jgi:ubiquinone biosynthesis monooxygenase Coq7
VIAQGPESLGDRILRVDHAGENGAVNIYRGQRWICRWLWRDQVDLLTSFQAHEERHRAVFSTALAQRGRRRCRSYHLCGLGGLLLGMSTALCGRAAIAATTFAVEQVVLRHLETQLSQLKPIDPTAHAAVLAIIEDEQEHHDHADDALTSRFWRHVLVPVVSTSTELVIWSGMKL